MPPLVQAPDGEPELVGSLNLYSHKTRGFDPFDEALMRLFTTATQAISRCWLISAGGRLASHFDEDRERLRVLEIVTDEALAHLSVDQLLRKLLDRVRELLVLDTTAVLLLDPSAHYLVATAARGLEEEVSRGMRIPLGEGFAGRIAAAKSPVVIDQVDHSNVLNPCSGEERPIPAGGAAAWTAWSSPPATSPAAAARSAGTGTTRSCSRPGTCGS